LATQIFGQAKDKQTLAQLHFKTCYFEMVLPMLTIVTYKGQFSL